MSISFESIKKSACKCDICKHGEKAFYRDYTWYCAFCYKKHIDKLAMETKRNKPKDEKQA